MDEYPDLECENLDDVFISAKSNAESDESPPNSFPTEPQIRAQLAEAIAQECHSYESVLYQLLHAISLEDDAIRQVYFLRVPPPVLDLTALARRPNIDYVQYLTADERRLLLGALDRIWSLYKSAHRNRGNWDERWHEIVKSMFDPSQSDLPSHLRTAKENFLAMSGGEQHSLVLFMEQLLLRFCGLEDLRSVLQSMRDLLRAVYGVRTRLNAEESNCRSTATVADTDAVRANEAKLFPGGVPRNSNIVDLVVRLDAERASGRSANEIARDFTGEQEGNDTRAQSLLSQIRRLKREKKISL